MDFNAAIREWIEKQPESFAVPVEAQRFVEHMRAKAANELEQWLHEHAAIFVADAMGQLLRSQRASAQHRQRAAEFADLAERVETGDASAMSELEVRYFVEDSWKPLRALTYADLDVVAGDYEQRAMSNAHEAAVLRALQKKLPKNCKKTVGDIFTVEQLRSLRLVA